MEEEERGEKDDETRNVDGDDLIVWRRGGGDIIEDVLSAANP